MKMRPLAPLAPLCALLCALTSCVRATAAAAPHSSQAWRVPLLFADSPVPATYQWVALNNGKSWGLVASGAGVVYEAQCVVQANDAADQLYVYFIDTANGLVRPSNGTTSINGGVSGGLKAVGDTVMWSDNTNAVLSFANGLMIAASKTPDTFTRPNAGDKIRCDAKLRSTTP